MTERTEVTLDEALIERAWCEAGNDPILEEGEWTTEWRTLLTVGDLIREVRRLSSALAEARRRIEDLAPEEPMNQDEQGGCVWCGGVPRRGMYASSDPKHHANDCAWVLGRDFLRRTSGEGDTRSEGEGRRNED